MLELIHDVGFWQFVACVLLAIILIDLMIK